jgi:hypothetical protein
MTKRSVLNGKEQLNRPISFSRLSVDDRANVPFLLLCKCPAGIMKGY